MNLFYAKVQLFFEICKKNARKMRLACIFQFRGRREAATV